MAKEKFDFIQPLKDIPKTLKGFPKNLVHIWKDPVKTSDEVKERKKEIYPYIYLFAGLCLVFLILSVTIPATKDIMTILVMIPGFGIIGCVFLLSIAKKAQEKFSNLECPNCKAQIKYDVNVQFKVISKNFSMTKEKKVMGNPQTVTMSTPMWVKVTGKETTTVEITSTCQSCGTKKVFTQQFVTAECNKFQNNIMAVNADTLLAQFTQDVRAESEEGFEGKTGTTARGVEVTYAPTLSSLVRGYFGNTIQMR